MDIEKLKRFKQTGDNNLRNQLVMENIALVYHTVKAFTKRSKPPPDLVQAGMIGLIEAINRFDVSKIVHDSPKLFFVFARCRILWELQKAVLSETGGNKNRQDTTARDMHEIISGSVTGDTQTPVSVAAIDIQRTISTLSPEENAVLLSWLDGGNMADIARACGTSPDWIAIKMEMLKHRIKRLTND